MSSPIVGGSRDDSFPLCWLNPRLFLNGYYLLFSAGIREHLPLQLVVFFGLVYTTNLCWYNYIAHEWGKSTPRPKCSGYTNLAPRVDSAVLLEEVFPLT